MRRHLRDYFGGNREAVLIRDAFQCRSCGAGDVSILHVHHRQPGNSDPDLLITVCSGCHARLHRLASIHRWIPGRWVFSGPNSIPLFLGSYSFLSGSRIERTARAGIAAPQPGLGRGGRRWWSTPVIYVDGVDNSAARVSRALQTRLRAGVRRLCCVGETGRAGTASDKGLVQPYRAFLEVKGR